MGQVQEGKFGHGKHGKSTEGGSARALHSPLIVMARLVRATHDLRDSGRFAAASCRPFETEIMGPPDKPGDDE